MKIEFEWSDGSTTIYSDVDAGDAWDLVDLVDPRGNEITSAWRDDEPWFGLCTDMREGAT